jgi:tetratricopeptide (TPR) repeat protein
MPKIEKIKAELCRRVGQFARYLFPDGHESGDEWCIGDVTGASGDSLKIVIAGLKQGTWKDFASGDTGSLIDLWMLNKGLADFSIAAHQCADWLAATPDLDDRPSQSSRRRENQKAAHGNNGNATNAPAFDWDACVSAMVSGVASLLPGLGIVAVITGHMARSRIKISGGRLKGRGLALAGLIMGYASLIIFGVFIAFSINCGSKAEKFLEKAQSAYEKGDYDTAIAYCSEILQIDGNNLFPSSNKHGDAYLRRGDAYRAKNNYNNAIEDYGEAIRLHFKLFTVFINRGIAYLGSKDPDKAIVDYNEAICLDPQNAVSYYNRGLAYLSKTDFDKAIADFDEAIRLNSGYAMAYCWRGYAYLRKGDPDKAITDYDNSIRLNAQNAPAYCWRGYAYINKGNANGAVVDFNEAIRLDPKCGDAYIGREKAHYINGDYADAIEDSKRAVELATNQPAVLTFTSMLYSICPRSELRDGPKAVKLSTTACELTHWKDYNDIEGLAVALAGVGDFESAIKRQQQAIEIAKGMNDDTTDMERALSLYQQHQPYREATR